MPERLFSIRSAPIMDSRRRIWALTAGWVRSNRWAALVKLPSSQIATNVRSRSVGILAGPEIGAGSASAAEAPAVLRGRLLRIGHAPHVCLHPQPSNQCQAAGLITHHAGVGMIAQ